MTIIYAILLFGFIIFIHELGHFLFAKLFNVRILKFSIGFGPKIIGKKIGETEYLLSAVPLGGYVKMLGEDIEDDEKEKNEEQLHFPYDPINDPRSFRNQSIPKRMAIVFAGPLFNLLTAVFIFFSIYIYGVPALLPIVGEVIDNTPAFRSGLQSGDKIIAINDKEIKQWTEMTDMIYKSANKPLVFSILRGDQKFKLTITPEPKTTKDIFGEEKTVGLIGIKPSDNVITIQSNLDEAIQKAFYKTGEIIYLTYVGIVKLIQRIVPADNIGGPILIFQLAEKTASTGLVSFFLFAAVISINLGILNLLPIPILDGGHILFLTIEAIIRRPINEKIIMVSQKIGLVLIMMLMAFAMYNDIFRIITGTSIP
ncbi:MAG: RIP metalloprotease RseP [Thermodesulfovibrionales bacterium]|nr:RIP metalloprotease RseP [Thermodesulfovibrionales bacterium]